MSRKLFQEGLSKMVPGSPASARAAEPRTALAKALEIEEGVNRLADAREIALDQIRPNPNQPRQTFGEAALDELAASIRQQGVLQPITVVPAEEGFEIVAGERRWRAARRAGLVRIPALVRDLSERDRKVIALMENLQREDLNDIDRARGLAELREMLGAETPDAASHELDDAAGSRLGISGRAVRNFVALLSLPPAIQEKIASGRLTEKHGRGLRRIREPELQSRASDLATRLRLTGDETVLLARMALDRPEEDLDQIAWKIKAGEAVRPAPSEECKRESSESGGREESARLLARLEEQWERLEAQAARNPADLAETETIERLKRLAARLNETIVRLSDATDREAI
jgi:ParB/RepB/Spo0J family partition protein